MINIHRTVTTVLENNVAKELNKTGSSLCMQQKALLAAKL